MSARRRAAFLRALEATGNVTISAERAGVSRSWVLNERRANAEFDAECKAARLAAFDALLAAESPAGPKGWGHLDGVVLVVRGTGSGGADAGAGAGAGEGAGGTAGRRVQIARARPHQWSPPVEERFLGTLEATGSVKAACAAAGMSKGSAYAHRKRWQGFSRRWDEAIQASTTGLELALLDCLGNPFSSHEPPAYVPTPPMRPERMLHNLHMHKHKTAGIGKRPGLRPREPAIEAKILRGVEIIRRGRALGEVGKARERETWALRRSSGLARRRSG